MGALDAVQIAEHIKNEELRMIAAVAALKNDRDRALKALKTLETETAAPGLKDAITKVLDEHTEDGVGKGSNVKMRSKSSNSEAEVESVANERNDQNDNEVLKDLSSNSWRKALYFLFIIFLVETLISFFKFGCKIFLSCLDYMATFMNRRSREHRYVAYVLNKEKQKLKTIMNNVSYFILKRNFLFIKTRLAFKFFLIVEICCNFY